jgi:hypothetical protein
MCCHKAQAKVVPEVLKGSPSEQFCENVSWVVRGADSRNRYCLLLLDLPSEGVEFDTDMFGVGMPNVVLYKMACCLIVAVDWCGDVYWERYALE